METEDITRLLSLLNNEEMSVRKEVKNRLINNGIVIDDDKIDYLISYSEYVSGVMGESVEYILEKIITLMQMAP